MDRDAKPEAPPFPGPVVLFDGVCKFCHRAVGFAIPRDRNTELRFAPLQSTIGRRILDDEGIVDGALDSVVLVDEDGCHVKSTAVLRIARRLSGPWPLLWGLMILPRSLRDWFYDRFAALRYRWFGTYETCPLPRPEVRARFLDGPLDPRSHRGLPAEPGEGLSATHAFAGNAATVREIENPRSDVDSE